MATMGCFPCCSSKVEKHKIIIPNVNVNEEHDVITTTPKFKKRLIRSSLTNSVKHLLKMKNTISFANISFKSESSKHKYISEELAKLGKVNVTTKIFSYDEVCEYTNNFIRENQIGEGGFGRVYKGYIDKLNQVVAVKQLDKNGFQGNKEFLVEIFILSLFHHPNLVTLVGYCTEGPQRILVYEYMANGSLEEHLLDLAPGMKKPLDWHTRIKIALGAARGLEYLHETANPPVIYRDFKASNILLDENFEPKLSDFGLAKFGPIDEDEHVSTRVMGTYGYCAPEYALTGQLTTKSDVYSFGVVFLEIITGKRVFDRSRPSEEQNLVLWAQPMLSNKNMFHIMADPGLDGKYPAKGLYQALGIAAMCLQEEAFARPSMSDIVTALDYLSSKYVYDPHYYEHEDEYDDDDDYDYDYDCDYSSDNNDNDEYNDNGDIDVVQGLVVDEEQQRSRGDEI